MDADGSNLQQLKVSPSPQCYFLPPLWSPDSRYIAFTTSENASIFCMSEFDEILPETNIEIYDSISGTSRSILPDQQKGTLFPAWSPDGSQIAFVSNRGGKPDIWITNVDGGDLRQVTDAGMSITFLEWIKP